MSVEITGQDIKEAYDEVMWPQEIREEYKKVGIPLGLRSWKNTGDKTKQHYNQLAEELNKRLAAKEHAG